MLLLLLQTIESEDDRAFLMDIYQQHYHKLYKEADSIVHNAYDAEDVVQEFMIYICDHINKFRALDCCVLPSYLVMCIRRRCINFLKRRETQKSMDEGRQISLLGACHRVVLLPDLYGFRPSQGDHCRDQGRTAS